MKLNNKQFNKFLGKKIKQGRRKAGFSQEELAKKLGFSRIALSTYESGRSKFTVYQLMLTSELLGIPFDYFLPKSTTQTETKTNIPVLNVDKDVEFMLEMSIRSYLLNKGYKKAGLAKIVQKIIRDISNISKNL